MLTCHLRSYTLLPSVVIYVCFSVSYFTYAVNFSTVFRFIITVGSNSENDDKLPINIRGSEKRQVGCK